MRYELDFYMLFGRHSVFKGLMMIVTVGVFSPVNGGPIANPRHCERHGNSERIASVSQFVPWRHSQLQTGNKKENVGFVMPQPYRASDGR
jgi:hypothetical protein